MDKQQLAAEVDWTRFGKISQTVTCQCDAKFRAHAKVICEDNQMVTLTDRPCPECKEYGNVRRVVSDQESWGI